MPSKIAVSLTVIPYPFRSPLLLGTQRLCHRYASPTFTAKCCRSQRRAHPTREPTARPPLSLHAKDFLAIPFAEIVGYDFLCLSSRDAEIRAVWIHCENWASGHTFPMSSDARFAAASRRFTFSKVACTATWRLP